MWSLPSFSAPLNTRASYRLHSEALLDIPVLRIGCQWWLFGRSNHTRRAHEEGGEDLNACFSFFTLLSLQNFTMGPMPCASNGIALKACRALDKLLICLYSLKYLGLIIVKYLPCKMCFPADFTVWGILKLGNETSGFTPALPLDTLGRSHYLSIPVFSSSQKTRRLGYTCIMDGLVYSLLKMWNLTFRFSLSHR